MIRKMLKNLLFLVGKNQSHAAIKSCFIFTVAALFDLIGIASIFPLISLILQPELVNESYYQKLYLLFKFSSVEHFIAIFGFFVLILTITSIFIRAWATYLSTAFSAELEKDLTQKFFTLYSTRRYDFFLAKHSSDFLKITTSEIPNFVHGVIMPILNIFSAIVLLVFITGLLLLTTGIVVFWFIISIGIVYLLLSTFYKPVLKERGNEVVDANKKRYQILVEYFSGIKEIKLFDLDSNFREEFEKLLQALKVNSVFASWFSQWPKFFIELIAFGGLLAFLIFLVLSGNELISMIPSLSVLLLAGYRTMPAFQNLYSNFSRLQYCMATIPVLLQELNLLERSKIRLDRRSISVYSPPLFKKIDIKEVYFKYKGSNDYAIDNVNLSIRRGQKIGFMGSSGSGKSTLVDLIVGLLNPSRGSIEIDNRKFSEKCKTEIQLQSGYVGQNFIFFDKSVTENLAFNDSSIDKEKIFKALDIANISGFVERLPNGLETKLGERGNSLSGGERQRLAISRAFLRANEILVLDEATSALDTENEKKILSALFNSFDKLTVLMIAHKLNVLKYCDIIYVLEHGRIIDSGTYEEISERNNLFAN